jgi:hypothetical protein
VLVLCLLGGCAAGQFRLNLFLLKWFVLYVFVERVERVEAASVGFRGLVYLFCGFLPSFSACL